MGRSSYSGGSTIIKTGAFVTSVNHTINQIEVNLNTLRKAIKTNKRNSVFNACRSLKKELPKLTSSKKGVLYLKSILDTLSEIGYFDRDFIQQLNDSIVNASSRFSEKGD